MNNAILFSSADVDLTLKLFKAFRKCRYMWLTTEMETMEDRFLIRAKFKGTGEPTLVPGEIFQREYENAICFRDGYLAAFNQ